MLAIIYCARKHVKTHNKLLYMGKNENTTLVEKAQFLIKEIHVTSNLI